MSIATGKVFEVDGKQKRIVMTEESLLDISSNEMDQFLSRRSIDNIESSSLILVDIAQSRSGKKAIFPAGAGRTDTAKTMIDRWVFLTTFATPKAICCTDLKGAASLCTERDGDGLQAGPVLFPVSGSWTDCRISPNNGRWPVGLFNRRNDEAGPEPAWGKFHADSQASIRGDTRIYDCSTPRQLHSSRYADSPSRREYSRDPRRENSADYSHWDNQKHH